MQAVYAKKALKYMVLPGIGPRITSFFASGFGPIAYLIATIYGMARLLPPSHPYRNPQNIGRFSIRNVIAEAANNLVLSRKNIDQITIFVAVLLGVFLLLAQFIILFYMLFVGSANAQISSQFTGSIFNTPNPADDIALKMLDRVFGVPGMFCNTGGLCTSIDDGSLPWPMHTGLHSLFEFYSFAMLLVGVLIFLYFAVVVVAETATSGTPFGQRFQNIWVPIRLVVALGLLVPINYGLNSGQYLALYSAKMGSALATNGWLRFNSTISNYMGEGTNPTGENKEAMVGIPRAQSPAGLVQAMSLVHTCAYGEWLQSTPEVKSAGDYSSTSFSRVQPYFVKNVSATTTAASSQLVSEGTAYTEALKFYGNADLVIRFGEQDVNKYPSEPGNVSPVCGEIRIPITSVAYSGNADTVGGADYILQSYFNMVKEMWFATGDTEGAGAMKAGAIRFNEVGIIEAQGRVDRACAAAHPNLESADCANVLPGSQWKQGMVVHYQSQVDLALKTAWQKYIAYKQDFEISEEILKFGWGGAGIWYNKIAEVNGSFLAAAMNVPVMAEFPLIMKKVREYKQQHDSAPSNDTLFSPTFSQDNGGITAGDLLGGDAEADKARVLSQAYQVWSQDGSDQTTEDKQVLGNAFQDAIILILGVNGVFSMRKENAHIHPLAQLSMVGKGMVEHTIRNMAIANTTAFMGGFSAQGGKVTGIMSLVTAVGSIFSTTAFVGLTAGVTLYYVLPFMPFIYFFFAVGAWVKSVFEAMVGVPLWALAHLRIDGEGLSGEPASSGYFLILEIGLRPILIVFGLIAAMLIFTAQVRILNYVWDLVSTNAAGFTKGGAFTIGTGKDQLEFRRDIFEEFSHTIIYAIIVYMLANASFKLIDMIPNEALRWIGSSATSYAKSDPNIASQLNQYVSTTGMVQGQQLAGAVERFSGGMGSATGQGLSSVGGLLGNLVPGKKG
ncbi:MAG: DotA/TraY family protein [Alphaproteobacteria bacterium]|nr:DotA/TraY family protein [Alphaproteobacteria bacterium]